MIRQVKLADKNEFFKIYNPLVLDREKLVSSLIYGVKVQKDGFQYLFSWVIIGPIANLASLYFHEKNNFLRAAIYSSKREFNLSNYKSILYYKKL